jgi:Zn-dependent protease
VLFLLPFWQNPIALVLYVVVLFVAVVLHEYGHALAALSQGDKTSADARGRFIWNPFHYLHGVGWLMALLLGVGVLGFVRTNPRNFRHPVWSGVLVSVAGVLMNALLALIALLLMRFFGVTILLVGCGSDFYIDVHLVVSDRFCLFSPSISGYAMFFLLQCLLTNVYMFVFNLLPIARLDGFWVLHYLFPRLAQRLWQQQWMQHPGALFFIFVVASIISYRPILQLNTGLLQLFLRQ